MKQNKKSFFKTYLFDTEHKYINPNGFWVRWGLVFFMIWVLFCGVMFFIQESLIFFPTHNGETLSSQDTNKFESVYFDNGGGVQLHGYFIKNKNSDTAVLFFHGNGGEASGRTDKFKVFSGLGLNGLIFDYQGYGNSEGDIQGSDDFFSDGEAALEFLHSRGFKDQNIILWGRSLGTAGAIDMAQNRNFKGVILESPFKNLKSISPYFVRAMIPSFFWKYKFENDEKVQNIIAPVLIFHGDSDEIFNSSHAEALLQNIPSKKQLVILEGGHYDFLTKGFDTYWKTVKEFLDESVRSMNQKAEKN